MCRPIVEEMALTGKAIEVNAALRAAAGAVKMMSLSEGVECPYVINEDAFKNQCQTPYDTNLPSTNSYEELQRVYVFFRAIQQGVQPPINIARLPEAEEKELVDKIIEVTSTFNSLPNEKDLNYGDYFLSNVLYIDPAQKDAIFTKFAAFIQKNTPIIAHNCKKITSNLVSDNRILGFFRKGPVYTRHELENSEVYTTDYMKMFEQMKGFLPFAVTSIYATNKLDNVIIKIITEDISLEKEESAIIDIKNPADITKIKNIFYIKIKKDNKISIPVNGISDIRIQSIFNYIFDNNLVIDMHPYLMYLVQTDKRPIYNVVTRYFNGNMTPPANYPLAFYIVAHYVANQPQYANNPATFYNKSYDDKKPEMLAAIKANEPAVDTLLRDGYAWLGEKYPGMGNIRQMLGDTTSALLGRRVAKAGESIKAGVGRAAAAIKRAVTRSQTKQKGGARRITRKASTPK